VILLDTDICIELLRGNKKVLKRRAAFPGEVAISFVAVGELFYGARNSAFPQENELLVEKFILTVPIVQTDLPILKRFGELKAGLKRNNRLLPDADIFVAAVALEKAEALVTGNTKHFERIEGLRIENWAAV
jgi:tRNA(fMet)-specific endonuclease VapC